tara:strand:+ start:144 stop:326 length:183 start_codon:yes stop_codon:yes gene_type:complete
MITKTVTDDTTLGLKKAVTVMDLPSITVTCYGATENAALNADTKQRLLDIVSELIDKNLS